VQGVITARLDRLERETKRILQEASVIGRAFLYEILKMITELKDGVDKSLNGLERLDFIRARTLQPDLEYIFKHALTQEVVYNGLLKKERQVLHERIGLVMEQLFHDRLPEFYETLAYHYKWSQSFVKALNYLIKAGEKSFKRYALEESHLYFKEAYDVLSSKPERTTEDEKLLIDLIIKWEHTHHFRADYKGLMPPRNNL
jgi:predicted ATPase